MLEEVRFLLSFKLDSYNQMSLILAGQSELREILKKQIYEVIRQRIDLRYHLNPYDRQQTGEYIKKHLEYAEETWDIFTEKAITKIYEYSHGIARKINKVYTACLMHAAQRHIEP